MDKLLLVYDHSNRAKYLDLAVDWYYTDANVDQHIKKAALSKQLLHHPPRIHIADPESDGQELLDFLSVDRNPLDIRLPTDSVTKK